MASSPVLTAVPQSTKPAGELLQTCNGVSKIEMAQAALLRLVNLETQELWTEAIVEKCRATRDLRNCGRTVQHVLASCGHASLCAECGQRCDVCPICRVSIRRSECMMRLRLYEECSEAGLIPPRDDDIRERDGHLNPDVQRLWSFFDVALENRLVSLICHYVSDVCMDDSAVSSNAVVSMLLDGTVVKEWCKRTFLLITRSLRDIYNLGSKQMQSKMSMLEKFGTKLSGLARVLETLEGPSSDTTSAFIVELQQLTEGVHRVSQHLEVMSWCVRHQFLENLPSCHSTIINWRTAVRGRKLAARDRAWPDQLRNTSQAVSGHSGTLFIEDAMLNVGYGKEHEDDFSRDNSELGFLRQGIGTSTVSVRRREVSGVQSAIQWSGVVYPPESIRAAVNLLFLEASSDLFLAKKAIFLYYLFDRHWPHCDGEYGTMIDDYMRSFDIPRHVMLESWVFYLLDNNNEMALQEACCILPEIVSCKIHPKVARVLLERQRPEAALNVLRCSSQDSNLRLPGSVSENGIPDVSDALTAIRARLECGLLTEAYIYQRSHALRVKEQVMKDAMEKMKVRDDKGVNTFRDSSAEMEQLIGEMCRLCMNRNLVDKMLELPWQVEEENIVQKCLLAQATRDPSSTAGNLMVVYYIMRCRNVEAYLVHKKLCSIEEAFIGKCNDEVKSSCVKNTRGQRILLVEKCIELLPEAQQTELRSGILDANTSVSPLDQKRDLFSQQLEANARIPVFLESAQASLPASSSPLNTKDGLSELPSRALADDTNMSVGWGDFRQPSIPHRKPFKVTSGGSTLLSQVNHTMFTSFARRESGGEQPSPILARKLIYNGETYSTCEPIQNTASTSHQEIIDVPNCQSDGRKCDIRKGRDPSLFVSQHFSSDSPRTNEVLGHGRSSANGESNLHNNCMRLNISERVQNGNFLLFDNSEPATIASNRTPKLGFRETENGTQGSMQLLGEDAHLGLLSSTETFKRRSRRHWFECPNGKRKAHDQLDAHEPSAASPVATADGSSRHLNIDAVKGSPNELHHGESSSDIEIRTFRAQSDTGIRWRAEDSEIESPPSHLLPPSKIKLYNMGRTISGIRSFRNHPL